MMKNLVLLVPVLILMIGLSFADQYSIAQQVQPQPAFQVVPVGIQAQDGVYVLTISNGGVVSIVPLQIISVDGTPPIQPPIDPPTVPTLSAQAMAIRVAALTVNDSDRAENAMKLSAVYDKVKETVDAGKVSGQANIAVMVQRVSAAILGSEASVLWKPVTDVFAEEWTSLVRDGASDGALSSYLGEASKGLKSVAGNQAISPQWIELIMLIIKMIIELMGN